MARWERDACGPLDHTEFGGPRMPGRTRVGQRGEGQVTHSIFRPGVGGVVKVKFCMRSSKGERVPEHLQRGRGKKVGRYHHAKNTRPLLGNRRSHWSNGRWRWKGSFYTRIPTSGATQERVPDQGDQRTNSHAKRTLKAIDLLNTKGRRTRWSDSERRHTDVQNRKEGRPGGLNTGNLFDNYQKTHREASSWQFAMPWPI